jgi:hypothetical protein
MILSSPESLAGAVAEKQMLPRSGLGLRLGL